MNIMDRLILKNKNFSVLCNNCVAWGIYRKLHLKYTSPTIGLFFWSDDYLSFLEDYPAMLKKELFFVNHSRHPQVEVWRKNNKWPIGLLGDVEIQFSHYKTMADASAAWKRRSQRLNDSNLFVMMFDKYGFDSSHFSRWLNLQFTHKLLFTSNPKFTGSNIVFMPEFEGTEGWSDSWLMNRKYEKYLNVVRWLNNKPGYLRMENIQ